MGWNADYRSAARHPKNHCSSRRALSQLARCYRRPWWSTTGSLDLTERSGVLDAAAA
jgi:hypothetical protein